MVAMPKRVAQSLENEQPCPFAHHQPVGLGVERRGFARGGQGPELREAHLCVERVGTRDAAGEHRVGAAGEEFVGRELDRVKRRRASRVKCVSAAAKPEPLGENPRREPRGMTVPTMREWTRRQLARAVAQGRFAKGEAQRLRGEFRG